MQKGANPSSSEFFTSDVNWSNNSNKNHSNNGWNSNSNNNGNSNIDVADVAPGAEEISLLNKLIHKSLNEDDNLNLQVIQADPSLPLYSVSNFEDLKLDQSLLKAIQYKGYLRPSRIQELTLPTLLSGQNMIAQAQSGTGKTASFVLAALSKIDVSKPCVQCLVLSPTFELVLQIADVFRTLSAFMEGVKFFTAVRGEKVDIEEIKKSHIIIGTLGTTLNWLKSGKVLTLENLKMLIIDEADVMIDSEAGNSENCIKIQKMCPENSQKMLFSATYPDKVVALANEIIPNSVIIRLNKGEEAVDTIQNYYFACQDESSKYTTLAEVYSSMTIGQSIIFCRTRKQAADLSERMIKDGHAVAMLTGALDVKQRASIMQRFRLGKERVLITTNVTARGIDIASVNLVVNYELPLNQNKEVDFETYLHRVGRTGRFGKKGVAINFINPSQMPLLKSIEDRYSIKIKSVATVL